jgi:hypothetical protein
MCLNVFIDIVIEFHHHFLIVTFLPCTPTYTFFFHSIQWLPSQHAIPLRSFFSIAVDPFQLSYNLSYFSCLYITPHSTFHIPHSMSSLVARSIAEPKLTYVSFSFSNTLKFATLGLSFTMFYQDYKEPKLIEYYKKLYNLFQCWFPNYTN